ncbi:hypothetical protein F1654_03555 [Alkalicaulis satelles]|uniref:Uncharacterized protein n=1 Tax=Alkalicaulis satelles TaxID=2609175 RepID=A0A5M6ZPB8_9PROT|nr:hypothetical protein [Alkalicaulis satelles]KAA5805078.1 hypothetical protein F1654_03555 [Alkalicaulis satelles]
MKTVLALMTALMVLTPAAAGEERACPHGDPRAINKLVAPVVRQDGRLAGYAFVTPRLCLARGYSMSNVREEEHFLMDALVRAVHANPFILHQDGVETDRSDAENAFSRAVNGRFGANVIAFDLAGDDMRLIRR